MTIKHRHVRGRSYSAYSSEYKTWLSMKRRSGRFAKGMQSVRYRDKGIMLCERWESFELFLADMGEKPTPEHTVDRIDPTRGYEPGNCRWATQIEQQRNRTNNVRTVVRGEELCLSEIAERYGFRKGTIVIRYARGDRGERLIRPLPAPKSDVAGGETT